MCSPMEMNKVDVRSSSRTSINVKLPSDLIGASENQRLQTRQTQPVTGLPLESTHKNKQPRVNSTNAESLTVQDSLHSKRLTQEDAVSRIEGAWITYRSKQMFRLLKHAICAAENSLSYDILKKISPREAELFNDKSQRVRVRFRFGGEEFPPMIFFKVYIDSARQKVTYMSGRKIIRSATEAAEDSLHQMGNRNFYSQILHDMIQHQRSLITDDIDIATLKDYMQYLASLDESPARHGGKENFWRKLTLDDLPRQTVFFDVINFVYNKRVMPRLNKEDIQILTARPVTQDILLKQILAVSKMRTPTHKSVQMPAPSQSRLSGTLSLTQESSRRSKQARLKSKKMRAVYGREMADNSSCNERVPSSAAAAVDVTDCFSGGLFADQMEVRAGSDEEWDMEADRLYEWTQELTFNDVM